MKKFETNTLLQGELHHGVLGQHTDYQFDYNPDLLFPIPRQAGRDLLGIAAELPFSGVDRWTAYELSWLNPQGLPQVAIVELDFSCHSPNIIESKSLKLYLNSFNQTPFQDYASVQQTLERDLSRVCGLSMQARLFRVNEYAPEPITGYQCLDDLPTVCREYLPQTNLLKVQEPIAEQEIAEQKFVSHLFRSLCPVTGQPDWASVFIVCSGKQIVPESLLQYLVSYRHHQGFHEQCVEQIFMDLQRYCEPQSLTVYARFLRRGGLDINPLRSSEAIFLLPNGRESRQ